MGSPSQRSGSAREALPDVQEWSEGPPGGPEVLERPSRRSRSGRKACWSSGSSREALPEIQE